MLTVKPILPAEEIAVLCRKYHVRELSLFGSVARRDDREDSDVDFLVEFETQARVGFLTLAGLGRELSELLGKPVDVVPKAGLKTVIRAQVLAEAQVVYAAWSMSYE